MALRVLLADESATIKKVIQLALQDFGVEVKSVAVGVDVLPVARSFNPDIIFADVLLTKRSGYEVSSDVKADHDLKHIPVVLMWSGFMDLDQGKVISSGVDRSIEKPFDPEQLRSVVKDLVPHLQTNAINSYLTFPDRPEFVEPAARGATPTRSQAPTAEDNISMFQSDDDEVEDFRHVPLPRARGNAAITNKDFAPKDHEDWSQADLAQFRVSPEGQSDDIPLPLIDEDVNDSPIVWSTSGEEVAIDSLNSSERSVSTNRQAKSSVNVDRNDRNDRGARAERSERQEPSNSRIDLNHEHDLGVPRLDFERAEQILREQAREVLESVAWRILPDIAERVIREELQKLLKDSERLDEI